MRARWSRVRSPAPWSGSTWRVGNLAAWARRYATISARCGLCIYQTIFEQSVVCSQPFAPCPAHTLCGNNQHVYRICLYHHCFASGRRIHCSRRKPFYCAVISKRGSVTHTWVSPSQSLPYRRRTLSRIRSRTHQFWERPQGFMTGPEQIAQACEPGINPGDRNRVTAAHHWSLICTHYCAAFQKINWCSESVDVRRGVG